MLIPGTIIKSRFKNEVEGHYYCEIKSYQEGTGILAEGYFVKIKEIKNNIVIFLNKRFCDEVSIRGRNKCLYRYIMLNRK